MTIYPQEYKLNCIKIGHHQYGISMSIGSTALASYTNCDDDSTDNCPGTELDGDTNTIRYTVGITWDGMNVSSESISQSTTGDQMYQCLVDNPRDAENRTRTLTIKGNVYEYIHSFTNNNYVSLFISTSNCSLFSY